MIKMARCLNSFNLNTVKHVLANPVIRTHVLNSAKVNVFMCSSCNSLRRELSSYPSHKIFYHQTQKKHGHFYRNLHKEVKAFDGLLRRSGFHGNDISQLLTSEVRNFSTSCKCCNNNKNEEESSSNKDGDKKNDKNKGPDPTELKLAMLYFVTMTAILIIFQQSRVRSEGLEISWNDFLNEMLLKGEVESVSINTGYAEITLHPGAFYKGQKSDFTNYYLRLPDLMKLEDKIRELEKERGINPIDQVSITYKRQIFPWKTFLVLLVLIILYFNVRVEKKTSMMNFPMNQAKFTRVDTLSQQGKFQTISFKEVAGLKEAKQEVMEFVDYLKAPDRFKALGAKIPSGALLLGPPGCGKTLLARAVASEAGVPFLAMAGSEFVEMIGGVGASRVRNLFQEAKKQCPCIIYIDEIDAVGRKRRSAESNSEEEQTLNQLLVEMDGMQSNKGVIMLASTNRVDILDQALLRPGRFDRHVTIDLPTLIERQEIFDMYVQKLKMLQNPVPSQFISRLAQLTPRMSGADIANVCNEAAIHAAREDKKAITPEDFDSALERVVAGVAKKTKLLNPSEKKVVAYHESGHALVGWMLKSTDALLRISMIPRTNNTLSFSQYLPSDVKPFSQNELFEKMCMALGGRCAELVIFNHATTAGQDDLKRVTDMAYQQIKSFGMSEAVGMISFPPQGENSFGTKPYSKRLSATIDAEAQKLVAKAFQSTQELLNKHKDKLHLLAENLQTKEILNYEDIEKLIGPPPHGSKNFIEPHGWDGMAHNDTNTGTSNSKSDESFKKQDREL